MCIGLTHGAFVYHIFVIHVYHFRVCFRPDEIESDGHRKKNVSDQVLLCCLHCYVVMSISYLTKLDTVNNFNKLYCNDVTLYVMKKELSQTCKQTTKLFNPKRAI